MPSYDATRYDPPAAIARVSLQRSDGGGALVRDVVLLIDTGADITLLPRLAVEHTGASMVVGARDVLNSLRLLFDGPNQEWSSA